MFKKKIIAMISLCMIVFSALLGTMSFANSPDIKADGIRLNESEDIPGGELKHASKARLPEGWTVVFDSKRRDMKYPMNQYFLDGEPVFCIEPMIPISVKPGRNAYAVKVDGNDIENGGSIYQRDLLYKINKIGMHYKVNTAKTSRDWAIAQLAIWKVNMQGIEDFGVSVLNTGNDAGVMAEVDRFIQDAEGFFNGHLFDLGDVKLYPGQTIIVEDKTGRFYDVFNLPTTSKLGLIFKRGEKPNTIEITAPEDIEGTEEFGKLEFKILDKFLEITGKPLRIFGKSGTAGGAQRVVEVGDVDPFRARLNVNLEEKNNITFYKKDSITGEFIAGGKYKIYTKDENGKEEIITTFTTNDKREGVRKDDQGRDMNELLKRKGFYYVKEIEAPYGYEVTPEEVKFQVNGTKKELQRVGLIEHAKTVYVAVTKVDIRDENKTLSGAEFTLFDKDGNELKDKDGNVYKAVTGENGVAVFEIPYNKALEIFVKETGAPEGYLLNEEMFKVEIVENYDFAKENPLKVKVADEPHKVAVVNTFIDSKAQTATVVLGIALTVVAATTISIKRRK